MRGTYPDSGGRGGRWPTFSLIDNFTLSRNILECSNILLFSLSRSTTQGVRNHAPATQVLTMSRESIKFETGIAYTMVVVE